MGCQARRLSWVKVRWWDARGAHVPAAAAAVIVRACGFCPAVLLLSCGLARCMRGQKEGWSRCVFSQLAVRIPRRIGCRAAPPQMGEAPGSAVAELFRPCCLPAAVSCHDARWRSMATWHAMHAGAVLGAASSGCLLPPWCTSGALATANWTGCCFWLPACWLLHWHDAGYPATGWRHLKMYGLPPAWPLRRCRQRDGCCLGSA